MKKIVVSRYTDYGEKKDYDKNINHLVIMGDEIMDAHDGYHSFSELYDHRITLYIALCKVFEAKCAPTQFKTEEGRVNDVWRSKRHSDGELCFGTGTQFVLGINKNKGEQITYHIPIERWDETDFAETLETAPEYDGHSSEDVLERLKKII